MKLGFTTTSFRQIGNLEKIVRIAGECRADILEWGGDIHVRTLADARRARDLCRGAGIGISSYGSYYRIGSGKTDEWIRVREIAAELGCGSVRVWLGETGSAKTSEPARERIIADAQRVCADAAEYGLAVACECHDRTYNDDTDAFLSIRDAVGCGNFKTYFQSRYRRMSYDLDRIGRTLPYTESVHISYSEQRREQFPRYDGAYIDALLERLLRLGFDGNLLLEYTYLFGRFGIPSCMKKDMERIGKQVNLR